MDWKTITDELVRSKAMLAILTMLIGYFFGDEGLKYFAGLDPEMRNLIVSTLITGAAGLMGWSRINSAITTQKLKDKVVDVRTGQQDTEQQLADLKRALRAKESEVEELKRIPPSNPEPEVKKPAPKKKTTSRVKPV